MTLSRVVHAGKGVVASEHPLASQAGCDALKAGGNAFDAAVATSFALAVTSHHIGGLGGDFFVTFYEAATGKVRCLNSSGWAPSGLTAELLRSKGESQVPQSGPMSCVIPGQVAGVWEMHRRHGSLDFGKLLAPAAAYASDGFPASEGFSASIAVAWDQLTPGARRVFSGDGQAPPPGAWIRQEALGRVIDEVARGGTDAFYRGWPAEEARAVLEAMGVPASPGDFRDFSPEWVEPLSAHYRGRRVYETPPNSMGATTLLMLEMLSKEDLSKHGPLSAERVRSTMEAAEVAYERKDRLLGDPRFGKVDMAAFMEPPKGAGAYAGEVRGGDTTAFSVADEKGNVVSAIQSLFRHFGSRVFVPACGIILNSRAAGFRGDGPNRVEPRKRPLHTLSSLIVEAGPDRLVAMGVSGGEYRPLQHTLLVTNLVDYGMTLERAVDHQRFLWSEGRDLVVEEGYSLPPGGRYSVKPQPLPGKTGVCQAAEALPRLRKGVCDVRGDGIPAGY